MEISVLRKRRVIFGIICGSILLLWLVLFECYFVSYMSDSPYNRAVICYSPNHEYYIKRYQTPFQAVMFKLDPKGIAILYDKTGKELTRGFVLLRDGPIWSFGYDVFYEGSDSDFHIDLPSFSGEHPDRDRGCFDEISDYVTPRPPLPPDRDVIVKGVEPLVKTNAPYQLQFLVEDQHGAPFTPLYYLIIREDGSRQRGETDEQGRSFVIESTHDEAVKIYFSPLQREDGFVMPEDIQGWCPESLDECIKTHTFTANTIKVKPVKTKAR